MPLYEKLQLLLVIKVDFCGKKESEGFEASEQIVQNSLCSAATLRGGAMEDRSIV